MYQILPQIKTQISDLPSSQTTPSVIPEDHHFLNEAIFAGDNFWGLEAALGRADGVVKSATGYCGGSLRKPSYREVSEGGTGHTEAVKVIYDKRKISYKTLCDLFWETHDPTNRNYLNFGTGTHHRSAIFYRSEEERKQAQESKIKKQMKLNKRIVTKITSLESEFFLAENEHQKYYLQQKHWLCQSLGLRSTLHFTESNIACKLNGILAMEGTQTIAQLTKFLKEHELPKQTKSICEEIILELVRKDDDFENP
ncbi:peptide methionine sulfoxide reductase [Morus notabilis]|nr:peptide methionine sulfoxide reductase [Morus notabilis]